MFAIRMCNLIGADSAVILDHLFPPTFAFSYVQFHRGGFRAGGCVGPGRPVRVEGRWPSDASTKSSLPSEESAVYVLVAVMKRKAAHGKRIISYPARVLPDPPAHAS